MNNGILNKRIFEIKYKIVFEKKIYCNNKFLNIIIVFLGGEFDKKKLFIWKISFFWFYKSVYFLLYC